MEEINIWKLLAGIGIFLFGLYLLEEALRQLSGRTFKSILRKSTDNLLKAITAGTVATAFLQSSSAVTLMLLAFVGAGVLGMENAVGVVLGSNLGTTLTSWIIATIGFKVKIEALALPVVALGSLGLFFFGRPPALAAAFKGVLGFGLLFLGLDYLKQGMETLTAHADLERLAGLNLPEFVLAGVVLTIVVQSSSVAMALALSGLHTGLLDFSGAAGMVIGFNIGTTVTVMLGAVRGAPAKKQVALSHFLFNVVTGLLALLLLPLLLRLLHLLLPLDQEPLIGLALFHTLFNLLGILLFAPFTRQLARLVKRLVPEKNQEVALYLNSLSSLVPDAALAALEKEIVHQLLRVMRHNRQLLQVPETVVPAAQAETRQRLQQDRHDTAEEQYAKIRSLQAEMVGFAARLQQLQLREEETLLLSRLLNAARSAWQAAKTMKDVKHEFALLDSEDSGILTAELDFIRKEQQEMYEHLLRLFEPTDQQLLLTDLVQLSGRVAAEDRHLMDHLTQVVQQNALERSLISSLLSASRGFIFSSKQLVRCLIELKIPTEMQGIFEHLEDYSQAAQAPAPEK